VNTERLFSDDPVDGTEVAPDVLGRRAYVEHVVALLERVRDQSDSSVLAMIAPWGAGKSSVLAMTISLLKAGGDADGWLVAEYNPWTYSDLESLVQGFFAELRQALPKDARWSEARQRLGEFAKAISPLGALGGLAGVDASTILAAAAEKLGGDTSAAATKRKAEESLREVGRPVLVMLDDLDRLTPQELLLVFKLVRLVGRLPNVYYLLCYDERTLLDVLRRTELVGDDEARGRDYLEKMVQVRLDLPPLRERQTGSLVDSALNAVITRNDLVVGPEDTHRLSLAYHEHLKDQLTTPRAVRRLFAQVDAFYGVVGAEVNFVDFVLVTFLRTVEPGVYAMLQRYKAELTATDPLVSMDRTATPRDRLDQWRQRLQDAGVPGDHIGGILAVLALLFVPIRSAKENMSYAASYLEDIARYRGVGHVDYFDRYFTFGVPEEDIADSVVRDALHQLGAHAGGAALEHLSARLVDDTDRVVRKLRTMRADGLTPPIELLELLGDRYLEIPEDVPFFGTDPRRTVEFFARDLLSDVPAAEGPTLLNRMSADDSGLALAAWVVARLPAQGTDADSETVSERVPKRITWSDDARHTVRELVTERLRSAASGQLADVPDDVFDLVWVWSQLDQDGLRAWLRDQVDSGRWSLLEVLGRLVPTGIQIGGGPRQRVLGDLSLGVVDDLFGLDHILDNLAEQIDRVDTNRGPRVTDPTPDQREEHVLATLRAARDRKIAESSGLDDDTTESTSAPSAPPEEDPDAAP
jgi:hypothetical protein